MRNKNNQMLIITSVLCLLPMIMSLVVYKDLPEQVAVHWDSAGNPNNFFPKAAAAFGLPFLFMVLNIFSQIKLFNDPKRANASPVIRIIMVWLIPFLALTVMPITLCIAIGMSISISVIVPIFTGMLFILVGNYLPKSRQNYTIGIKLPWTLYSADNWNKTHRMAGHLYIAGGILLIALPFISFKNLPGSVITISIVILLVIFPMPYSFWLYKKDGDSGETD